MLPCLPAHPISCGSLREQWETAALHFPALTRHATIRRPAAWLAAVLAIAALVPPAANAGVAVLLVDTDRVPGQIDERIYGHFLEHINHSVVDGLYAEQVRGQGFEGRDFADYWKPFGENGTATVVEERFEQGERSVRLAATAGTAGLRQDRLYLEAGSTYDGSVWLKPIEGNLAVRLRVVDSAGRELAQLPLKTSGTVWQELPFRFESPATDPQASLEIVGAGTGAVLVDFVSLMRADSRAEGKLRPDLLESLKALRPPFIRWPGGSFASIYQWQDGIGPAVSRKFHPNTIWGGYSDYYGFGTDEFLELCRQLGTEPMIVLNATSTAPEQIEYAMNWVHYLLDAPTTEWGRRRAANGHAEPYRVPYIQIDNEPMNHGHTPEAYAAIVNAYGSRLREIAPAVKIVAAGQKRSNDLNWSQKLIDLAGENFDLLGCHNYEYEPENYATGVRRIEDYLEKLGDYVRASAHPQIRIAVLEWGLCRTADWRAGLHAAGLLMSYEKLSPMVDLTCPALLMRNTTDNPEWRAWIYHDHATWFPGGGYVAEKLFRDHYAPKRYAYTSGTFSDIPRRADFFDDISQMKPTDWTAGTVDAIASGSEDDQRLVIKAVNYDGQPHTLLARLQGARLPTAATVTVAMVTAAPDAENSLAAPKTIHPVESTLPYTRDLALDLPAYTVAVIEIHGGSARP
ncbi:alpha-L-arabinofuranosidase C-terminal domain-containing protein [Opitutus terrae]|uniref:non-reducing end alpha-L-arabinofuranosidase n=1 Tax=Opitutus terrae (strain DSM 11246 / JCM 15787 / PB90-1) TaxID=452637 RepID=B1ZN40_OPITP|nr:alpha-L-arabinofuranosidase C-terminal domain-containing protein [Opitutus terrae]ACB76492.1 Alpha-N-arabinofuranosidase [Opitutus terrae PB90-1]